MTVSYIHLPAEAQPPSLTDASPFRAVLVLEQAVSGERQNKVCEWLVHSGCLYAMSWGVQCSTWDDSVDWAALSEFNFSDIPDERFVMSTWHDDESLADVFRFAGSCAQHPTVPLERTVIVDVGPTNRELEMLEAYRAAQTKLI